MQIDSATIEIQRLRTALQEISEKGGNEGVEDGQIVEWDGTYCAAIAERALSKTEGASQMTHNATIYIDAERVEDIFLECLLKEGEDNNKHVSAEGILRDVEFHAERLNEHKEEIEALLDELPNEFKMTGGGGMSFIQACNDKHGNQWTGLHARMEQLFQLGIGIEKVECLNPREVWTFMPGGMPYYVVK